MTRLDRCCGQTKNHAVAEELHVKTIFMLGIHLRRSCQKRTPKQLTRLGASLKFATSNLGYGPGGGVSGGDRGSTRSGLTKREPKIVRRKEN